MRATVIVFALCAAACFVAHVAILRSVLRSDAGNTPLEPGVPRPRIGVEVVWAVIPMLALALVLTATWARVQSHGAPPPEPIMEVAR
jgi:heme/copper-type cytochrome/quinol oxidase subunit 2